MSKWSVTRARNQALKRLGQFSITKRYYFTDGKLDYNRPVYYAQPRGFATYIAKIDKPDNISSVDFERFMDAVRELADTGAAS